MVVSRNCPLRAKDGGSASPGPFMQRLTPLPTLLRKRGASVDEDTRATFECFAMVLPFPEGSTAERPEMPLQGVRVQVGGSSGAVMPQSPIINHRGPDARLLLGAGFAALGRQAGRPRRRPVGA